MKRKLLKIAGGIVGIIFIIFGIQLFVNPLFDNTLEKINSFVFLILGGLFIKHAVIGTKKSED